MIMTGIKHTLAGHSKLWKPHVQSRPDTDREGTVYTVLTGLEKTQKPDST